MNPKAKTRLTGILIAVASICFMIVYISLQSAGISLSSITEDSSKANTQIEVVDWTNRRGGDFLVVEGILRNIGTERARRVYVAIETFDKNGKLLSLEPSWHPKETTLDPGQKTTFRAVLDYVPGITMVHINAYAR